MDMIEIVVDGREIKVNEGTSLLRACLDKGIYIPNLCHVDAERESPASCRLCFVEVEGMEGPVCSCRMEAAEGMVVRTDTPVVRRLQRTALELLLSVHRVDCAHCSANKRCELQKIARFLKVGLKPRLLGHFLKDEEVVDDHPVLNYYPNRCVLCGRCVRVCGTLHPTPHMDFADRGFKTVIFFHGPHGKEALPCEGCMACVEICPVGAIGLVPIHK